MTSRRWKSGAGWAGLQDEFAGVVAVHTEVEENLPHPAENYAGLHHPSVDPHEEEDHHEDAGEREQRVEPEGVEEGDLGSGGVSQPVDGPHPSNDDRPFPSKWWRGLSNIAIASDDG